MPAFRAGGGISSAGTITQNIRQGPDSTTKSTLVNFTAPNTTVTWNPLDKAAAITLSGGNLTAAGSGAARESARATLSRISGLFYFEVTAVTSGSDPGIGLANDSAALNEWIGNTVNSSGYHGSGNVYYNGISQGAGAAYFGADVIGVAANLTTGKVWYYKNGVLQFGDPVAGTGGASLPTGALFPFFFSESGTGSTLTANFGATAFTYAPPSGFTGWELEPSSATTNITGAVNASFSDSGTVLGIGALTGSSSPAFTDTGTLLGNGAISGASSPAFSNAGTATGKGALTGAANPAFTDTGALLGTGSISGASSPAFSDSGTILGKGSITGSSSPAFSLSATVVGKGSLSGTTSPAFSASGAILGLGAIVGASSATFALSGTQSGSGGLTGTTSPSFALSGTLATAGNTVTAITASATVTFSAAATLTGFALWTDETADPATWTPENPAAGIWTAGVPTPGTWTPGTEDTVVWTPQAVPASSWN